MKIVTVTHFFPAHGGGLEWVAEKLVQEFAACGIDIQWFSSNTDPAPESARHRASISVATSNFIERATQLPYPLWSPAMLPTLWRAIGAADVVHVHEHLYHSSILAIVIGALRRRPVVITQHMGALALRSAMATRLYSMGARLLGWALFRAAARSVFISANVRTFFDLDRSPNAHVIYNGLDTDTFQATEPPAAQRARGRLGWPHDRRVVLFVGRFVRKKGFHILKALARAMPDVLWVFVGSGPEDPSAWQFDNVLVAGRVQHRHLATYYQCADLLLLPSAGEGFPLVVQEALACGLGVLSTQEVATACPEARDLIRTPVPNADLDESAIWLRAARAAIDDTDYLDARPIRASQARELWSWRQCSQQYLKLFDEIALRRKTSRYVTPRSID